MKRQKSRSLLGLVIVKVESRNSEVFSSSNKVQAYTCGLSSDNDFNVILIIRVWCKLYMSIYDMNRKEKDTWSKW